MFSNASKLANVSINDIVHYLSLTTSFDPVRRLGDDDWENIAVTAIALGLAPLLHWHLEQTNVTVPPLALAKLAITRQAHAKRNESIARQLAEVLKVCAREKLDVLVLKGAFLAPAAYADASLRPMNDIDLLFRPQDLVKVGLILENLGYKGKHKHADQGPGITKHVNTYRRDGNLGATPNPYLSPSGDRVIEPHGSLEESWFGLKVDITPGVWDRAVSTQLHHQPAYRLSTSDLVIHLAVHATFHLIMASSVLLQLYDIGQVVKTWRDQLDWTQILTLTQKAQAEPFVYAALFWAKSIFNASIPSEPIKQLEENCASSLTAYIQSLDASAIFNRTQHPPLVSIAQRLRRGIEDRRETARWASSLTGKWQVWQTAFAFYKTDTANILQKKLKA